VHTLTLADLSLRFALSVLLPKSHHFLLLLMALSLLRRQLTHLQTQQLLTRPAEHATEGELLVLGRNIHGLLRSHRVCPLQTSQLLPVHPTVGKVLQLSLLDLCLQVDELALQPTLLVE
jgi:hypothetical protein